jgi:hypothetical protein
MSNVHQGRALTARILAVLQAAGLRAAVSGKSATAGWTGASNLSTFNGYVILYPTTGGSTSGTIDDPDEDADVLYQVTAIGADAGQVEWLADKARLAIKAGTYPPVDGRSVVSVKIDMIGGVERDDDVQPPVFYQPDRYRFMTAPT